MGNEESKYEVVLANGERETVTASAEEVRDLRRQIAEEIAQAIEAEARERQSTRLQAYAAAAIARRIGGAS